MQWQVDHFKHIVSRQHHISNEQQLDRYSPAPLKCAHVTTGQYGACSKAPAM